MQVFTFATWMTRGQSFACAASSSPFIWFCQKWSSCGQLFGELVLSSRLRNSCMMSAVVPEADINRYHLDVGFVPIATNAPLHDQHKKKDRQLRWFLRNLIGRLDQVPIRI